MTANRVDRHRDWPDIGSAMVDASTAADRMRASNRRRASHSHGLSESSIQSNSSDASPDVACSKSLTDRKPAVSHARKTLTTDAGAPLADNQKSLTAGPATRFVAEPATD